MKSKNLDILKLNNINVPNYIVVKDYSNDILNFSSNNLFAIRSNSILEDDMKNSYAGQFKSFLNVPKEEIQDKIKLVKDSYKKLGDNKSNEVIIQEMINCEYSGVIFTANPIGILNEVVITVGKGLGENVVEDKVNTTSYYYNKDDKCYYYEQQDSSPLLDEHILKELFLLSEKIEKIFDTYVDIEFGVKDDIIYILQTRPITTINTNQFIVLDNSNIVESYPGVSLPLTQSFVKDIYYKVFKRCVLRLTNDDNLVINMDDNLKDMVDVANGHIYYRITNWYDVLSLLPFEKKIMTIWQEMLGVKNKKIINNKIKVSKLTKLKIIRNFIFYLLKTPKYMDKLNDYFDKKYLIYKDKINKSNDVVSLLNTYYEIKQDLTDKWDITLINDMYTFIYTYLSGKKNKSKISQISNLESLKPLLLLDNLMYEYEFLGEDSEKFREHFNDYISLYGDRVLNELKLETKTYRTNPELLLDYLKQIKSIEINHSKEIIERNPIVKRAKIGIYNREVSRMNRTRIFGLTREIFLKIGEIFESQNKLANQRDIFYLFEDEIKENRNTYQDLISYRKIEYENYEKLPEYSRLVYNDKIINKTNYNCQLSLFNNNELFGIASSIGKITGEVLVIDNANTCIDTTNKILVTKTTDPGWAFLIKNCLGIIAEHGSMLSHTAIITRELGKPSIVNVKDVTSLLKTGDIVTMDAYKGIIRKEN